MFDSNISAKEYSTCSFSHLHVQLSLWSWVLNLWGFQMF